MGITFINPPWKNREPYQHAFDAFYFKLYLEKLKSKNPKLKDLSDDEIEDVNTLAAQKLMAAFPELKDMERM